MRAPPDFPNPSRSRGFTLVELTATVAVATIVVAIGVPSLRRAIESRHLDRAVMAMFSTLGLARSEAIKRNAPVVLCKSPDGAACAAGGGWEQGWVTFHDANNNADLDAGETVIQKAEAVGAGVHFSGNLKVARYISFSGVGAPRTVGGAFQAGTLTACRDKQGRQVILSATGRARLGKAPAADCQ